MATTTKPNSPYLTDITLLAKVSWGRGWLWDCKIGAGTAISPASIVPAPKHPFDTWFPAVEVRENLATLVSKEVEAYIATYKIPQSTSSFSIELTFLDDANETLVGWLTDWINNIILGGGEYLLPLEEVVAPLYIAKLNPDRSLLDIEHAVSGYMVYPEGEIYYQGESEGGQHRYQVTFISVGSIKS